MILVNFQIFDIMKTTYFKIVFVISQTIQITHSDCWTLFS